MRALGLIVLVAVLAAAGWWWLTQEQPRRERERAMAARAAVAQAERAASLYRWRDAAGTLHISDTPPKGVKYQRISREPAPGIRVEGRPD